MAEPIERWITDNEPSVRYPIYTRANAGEVYPDPSRRCRAASPC
jgi:pyruvate,water dikinase